MSSRRKAIIGTVLGLCLAAIAAMAFWFAFEKVEREVYDPPSGEARTNPYLALERLLDRVCCTSYTLGSVDTPEYDDMVIILADPDRDLSPEQLDAWVRWVGQGGHLILPAPMQAEASDPLLDRLGFEQKEEKSKEKEKEGEEEGQGGEKSKEKDEQEEEKSEEEEESVEPSLGAEREVTYEFDGFSSSLFKATASDASLSWQADAADWLARHTDGSPFAISRREGYGRVTLMDSISILRNRSIGRGEHARFSAEMVTLGTDVKVPDGALVDLPTIAIVRHNQRQSWIAYVIGHTWPFFIVLVAILVLALLQGRVRFGPQIADPPPQRRSRLEHIDATGRFLWQHGSSATLVEASQKALLRVLERRRPNLKSATGGVRHAIIADELDITQEEARRLFVGPSGNRNTEHFTDWIRRLERHRRKIENLRRR